MPYIQVSDFVIQEIEKRTILPFTNSGRKLPGGWWLIPVDAEVYDALKSQKDSEETFNDFLERTLARKV